jgi:hypothetical protein
MDLGNLQIRNLESHPTGPDMSSVLILVMGSVQVPTASTHQPPSAAQLDAAKLTSCVCVCVCVHTVCVALNV